MVYGCCWACEKKHKVLAAPFIPMFIGAAVFEI
jgi:hypothetical protein